MRRNASPSSGADIPAEGAPAVAQPDKSNTAPIAVDLIIALRVSLVAMTLLPARRIARFGVPSRTSPQRPKIRCYGSSLSARSYRNGKNGQACSCIGHEYWWLMKIKRRIDVRDNLCASAAAILDHPHELRPGRQDQRRFVRCIDREAAAGERQ